MSNNETETMKANERLTYSVTEAARVLGISRNSCYAACERGELPCLKIGKRILIPRARLDRLLSDNGDRDQRGAP